MKIRINDTTYTVKVAETQEERRKGLKGVADLPEDEGMLFIFDEGSDVSMTMEDTPIPLDQIFMDDEGTVLKVVTREPDDDALVSYRNTTYVLELNAHSGIHKGDEMEFLDDEKNQTNTHSKMLVLDENGEVQMELEGGERIFSRPNTKVLVKLAKRAYSTKSDSDYKRLGKKLFQFLTTQDSNDPQYVELKKDDDEKVSSDSRS